MSEAAYVVARGIEEISKVHVGGGVYRAATSLTRQERSARLAQRRGGQRLGPRRGVSEADESFRTGREDMPLVHRQLTSSRPGLMPMGVAVKPPITRNGRKIADLRHDPMFNSLGEGVHGQTRLVGGRRGGAIMQTSTTAPEKTHAHELAHASPKRSSYRLHQVISNPKKLWREEARADMTAGIDYRKPAALGSQLKRGEIGYAGAAALQAASGGGKVGARIPAVRRVGQRIYDRKVAGSSAVDGQYQFDRNNVQAYRDVADRIRTARGGRR